MKSSECDSGSQTSIWLASDIWTNLCVSELQKEKEKLDTECKQVLQENNVVETKKQEEEDKKVEVNKLISNQKNVVFLKEKDYNDLQKQLELEKEKETVLLADK